MKTLFFGSLIILSTVYNVNAKDLNSEVKLKTCITNTYQAAANSQLPSNETLKAVSMGIKECRKSIADIKKAEREAKKAANNLKRIEKLKSQLAKLQG